MIRKGKTNPVKKPQVMVINPNSNDAVGDICHVRVLSRYFKMWQSLPGTLLSELIFPKTQLAQQPSGGMSHVYLTTPL